MSKALWDSAVKRSRIKPFRQLAEDTETLFRLFIDGHNGLDDYVREQGVKHLRASREMRFGKIENDPQP